MRSLSSAPMCASGATAAGRAPRLAGASSTTAAAATQQQQRRRRQQPQPLQQQQQQQTPSQTQQQLAHAGRRGALLGGFALLALPAVARAAEPVQQQQQQSTQGAALEEYMELEAKGKMKDRRQLDDFRARFGIRRLLDGRVQLRSRKGEWHTVRLDMEVAGALLLRDPRGNIFAIETDGLPQVDLSDDYVLLMLFSDGSWQDQMQAIEYEDADEPGRVVQLNMSESEFREFVGILAGVDEDDEKDKKKKKGKK
ncbi:hypothetical protein Rsub_06364 [Raphidocelis subcapitata]|uniref:Uncharacterized protein n=1 Tax=Raphidocelis subcapitata TaxID=307507 RepID=A0A2V0P0C9_9CHLO|nr:hypothetical protein Rsub_06364 [Raphidocelis subcapitata]|eukprot:GBF93326.1 hypothetical protein Rsub_06364 [Raphidocelis subcapitata]